MKTQRSPRYPAATLAEAIRAARALWAKEKRTAVGEEVLAKAIGYKGLSGASRTMIAALRQYGLLSKQAGGWSLSDTAMEIIHNSEGSQEQVKAIQDAALQPDLFRDLFSSHPHASEDAIKSYLILKKGFLDSGARQAAAAYRETIAFAKLTESGYTANEVDEMANIDTTVGRSAVSSTEASAKVETKANQLATQVLAVSIPRKLSVSIDVRGDQLRREDLAKIKNQFNRWIEGLEEAFEE